MLWLRCVVLAALVAVLSAQEPLQVPQDLNAALAALPVTPPAESGQRILVTRAGQPVAGADVYVVDGAQLRGFAAAVAPFAEVSDLSLARCADLRACWWGKRYQTSADGVVRIALGPKDWVHARVLDGFGMLGRSAQPEETRTIELADLREVRVLVQDPRGRPVARVPVRLVWRSGSAQHYAERLSTDAQGRVTLMAGGGPRGYELAAAVDCIGTDPEFTAVGQAKELTLTAPGAGMLRVIAYDEQNRPRSGVREVMLEVVSAPWGSALRHHLHRASKLEPDGATFRGVALGQSFTAYVMFDGVAGQQTVTGDGPKLPNELVVLTLGGKLGDPKLALRVLDATGVPRGGQTFALVQASDIGFSFMKVVADARGQLDMILPAAWRAAEGQRLLLLSRGKPGPTAYQGAVDLTALAQQPPGSVRHDVQLREEPPVVAGRVVDGEGKPVAGLTLSVDYSWSERSPSVRNFSGRSDVALEHEVVTDGEGRFTCRELSPKSVPLGLRVQASGWVIASERWLMPGGLETRIVVSKPGRVVLQMPGVPEGTTFYAKLEPEGNNLSAHRFGADGRLTFDSVAPGKWHLKGHMGMESFELPGLEVVGGADCADPRLVVADWREKFVLVDTKVRSAQGKPLDRVDVFVQNAGGMSSSGASASGERVLMLVPKAATRITFSQADHASVELDPEAIPAEVTMQRRATVVMRLPDGVKLPAGVEMWLYQPDAHSSEGVVWPGGDRLEVALPSLRDCKVMVLIQREVRPGVRAPPEVWQGRLEFRPGVAKQEVTLDLAKEDAERIAELWAEAKEAEKAEAAKGKR